MGKTPISHQRIPDLHQELEIFLSILIIEEDLKGLGIAQGGKKKNIQRMYVIRTNNTLFLFHYF